VWQDDREYPTFMTMREMARFYLTINDEAITGNKLGRILTKAGLRDSDGEPSPRARRLGMVSKRPVHWNKHWTVTTWHFEKSKPILLASGLKLKPGCEEGLAFQ